MASFARDVASSSFAHLYGGGGVGTAQKEERRWREEAFAASGKSSRLLDLPNTSRTLERLSKSSHISMSVPHLGSMSMASFMGGGSEQQYSNSYSSPAVPLTYTVERVSTQTAVGPASAVLRSNHLRHWGTTSRDKEECIVLKLKEKSLLSYIRIDNRQTSACHVSVSNFSDGKKEKHYIPACRREVIPHHRSFTMKVGHLPCTFVKITCTRGSPISLFSIRLYGMRVDNVESELGSSMQSLLVDKTETIIYPSKAEIETASRASASTSPYAQKNLNRSYGGSRFKLSRN